MTIHETRQNIRDTLSALKQELENLENGKPETPSPERVTATAKQALPSILPKKTSLGLLRTAIPRRTYPSFLPLVTTVFRTPAQQPSFLPYDPLPEKEAKQALPNPLINPTMTYCHLNAWITLIQTNPELWNRYNLPLSKQIETVSLNETLVSNAIQLGDTLFPPVEGNRRQQDVSETIFKFSRYFTDFGVPTTKTTKKTYRAVEYLDHETIETNLQRPFKKEGDFFVIPKNETVLLPILRVSPHSGKSLNLSQAINEQCLLPQKPKGDRETLSIEMTGEDTPALILEEESTQFASAPSSLVFHAERNHASGNKNMGKIQLPERMDLPGPLFSESQDPTYQLRGFIVHLSSQRPDGTYSPDSGHYISYVKLKGEDGKTHYYRLDDAPVPEKDDDFIESPQREISREEFLKAGKQFTIAVYNKL